MLNSPYKKYQKQTAILLPALCAKNTDNFYLSYFKQEANTHLFKQLRGATEWFCFEKQLK